MLQCVKLLKTAAPTSVNLEDNEGCNAIEYALENEIDIKVVKAMQRACRDDWRERKAEVGEQGRKTHEDLVKDVQMRARQLQAQMSARRLNADGMEVEETKLGDTGRVSFHRVSGMSNSFVAKTA
jgi:phosphosulfolactate phosphohydrolase-like enzyme